MPTDLSKGFRLGPWQVQPQLGSLSGPDGDGRLEPKVMDVLVCLATAGSELVSRDQLLKSVWGERAFSEEPLNRAIGELRRALGDSPKEPTYIETVPKRGYRLLVDVSAEEPTATSSSDPASRTSDTQASTPIGWRRPGYIAGALFAALAAFITVDRLLLEDFDAAPTVSVPERPTVAVLPFCDLGAEEVAPYVGSGITEDLTTLLARSPELIVISNRSASAYACEPENTVEVGRKLTANYLVTGSVRISTADQVRITVQFIDTMIDQVMWADTYERPFDPTSVLEIQSEIADKVARSLQVQIMQWKGKAVTANPTAWDLYARGRFLIRTALPDNVRQGRELLEQAIEVDPLLADAHAYLGMSHTYEFQLSWDPDPRKLHQAELHIKEALSLDPNHHVGLTMLGHISLLRGQPRPAMRYAQQAIQQVPSYDSASAMLGLGHMQLGQPIEARAAFADALSINPSTPKGTVSSFWAFMGSALFLDGEVKQAVEYWEEAGRAIPGIGQGPIMLANYYESVGRHEDARGVVAEILALHPQATAQKGFGYLAVRMPEERIPAGLVSNLRAAGLP